MVRRRSGRDAGAERRGGGDRTAGHRVSRPSSSRCRLRDSAQPALEGRAANSWCPASTAPRHPATLSGATATASSWRSRSARSAARPGQSIARSTGVAACRARRLPVESRCAGIEQQVIARLEQDHDSARPSSWPANARCRRYRDDASLCRGTRGVGDATAAFGQARGARLPNPDFATRCRWRRPRRSPTAATGNSAIRASASSSAIAHADMPGTRRRPGSGPHPERSPAVRRRAVPPRWCADLLTRDVSHLTLPGARYVGSSIEPLFTVPTGPCSALPALEAHARRCDRVPRVRRRRTNSRSARPADRRASSTRLAETTCRHGNPIRARVSRDQRIGKSRTDGTATARSSSFARLLRLQRQRRA